MFSQTNLGLKFYDTCTGEVLSLEYELNAVDDFTQSYVSNASKVEDLPFGSYFVSLDLNRNPDWTISFGISIEVNQSVLTDTLDLPSISFAWSGALHDPRMTYLCCDKVCDGYVRSIGRNGYISMDGDFDYGKPRLISEYGEKGIVQTRTYYSQSDARIERQEFYNDDGELWFYTTYRYRKRKTIILSFDASGKREGREVEKHAIVK